MRDGRAGLGHPAWEGGGGGQAEACLQGGSERPEAGCLGEYRLLLGGCSTQDLVFRIFRF